MRRTNSFQTIARTLVRLAWDGKAKVTFKKDPSQKHEPRFNAAFSLTVPKVETLDLEDVSAVANAFDLFPFQSYGSMNEVWEAFLERELKPAIRRAFIAAMVRAKESTELEAAVFILGFQDEDLSPAEIKDPTAHRLACALSPRGNWLPCDGEAHSNPHIDNCGECAPNWGWITVPVGVHTWEQYQIRRDREQDAATWSDTPPAALGTYESGGVFPKEGN